MAIFGKLEDLSSLFSKTEELEYLHLQIQNLFSSDFLRQIQDLKSGEQFKTPLEHGIFCITHCYRLKGREEAFFESHRQFVDVQVVLEGFERYLIAPPDRFNILEPYEEKRDLQIYTAQSSPSSLLLRSQEICILFPHDVHGVGIGEEEEIGQQVKKAIFKVPKQLIKHRL